MPSMSPTPKCRREARFEDGPRLVLNESRKSAIPGGPPQLIVLQESHHRCSKRTAAARRHHRRAIRPLELAREKRRTHSG